MTKLLRFKEKDSIFQNNNNAHNIIIAMSNCMHVHVSMHEMVITHIYMQVIAREGVLVQSNSKQNTL